MYRIIMVIGLMLMTSNIMAAEKSPDHLMFEKIFIKWTDAFNHKDLARSCNLFSKNMIADYQGIPTKNYSSVCNGFKKIFHETRDYRYHFKLHQVYRSNNLAAVRITWYLRISKNNKFISSTQDEGIDIFQKDNHAAWKILNYLAYPARNFTLAIE